MKEFIDFIASVLEVEPSALSENTAYGECEKWDSLMHMRIVMEVEDRYDIEIPIEDIPKIKTIRDFYNYTVR